MLLLLLRLGLLLLLLMLLLSTGHHLANLADKLHRHREHYRLIVLDGDVGQGLEVPQLKHESRIKYVSMNVTQIWSDLEGRGTIKDCVRGQMQRSARSMLTLCSNNLENKNLNLKSFFGNITNLGLG